MPPVACATHLVCSSSWRLVRESRASNQIPPRSLSQDVTAALGLSRNDRVEGLVAAIGRRDAGEALRVVQDAVDDGEDPRQLNRQLLAYLRLLLIERSGGTGDADARARELAAMFSLSELAAMARRFGEIDFTIKHAPYPQLPLEVALVEAVAIAAPESGTSRTPVSGLSSHAHSDPAAAAPAPPTSLRDRVRSPSSIREIPPPEPARSDHAEPATITPLRSMPVAEAAADRRASRRSFLRDRANRGALAECARGRQGAEPAHRGAAE